MTPKEKAKELFGKYAMYLRANLMYDEEANEDAKQCAKIAVDEMLTWFKAHSYSNKNYDAFVFYNEVRQEIDAL